MRYLFIHTLLQGISILHLPMTGTPQQHLSWADEVDDDQNEEWKTVQQEQQQKAAKSIVREDQLMTCINCGGNVLKYTLPANQTGACHDLHLKEASYAKFKSVCSGCIQVQEGPVESFPIKCDQCNGKNNLMMVGL
jgi:hypothetical protein